ncbi:hypothetical protein [Streptomyces sp. NPDC088178]|uniref:hypothetical protein n=1 Tax=Streptomyces sp. NPDC088178 TaxID=3365836 RepID=UPI0037FF59B8
MAAPLVKTDRTTIRRRTASRTALSTGLLAVSLFVSACAGPPREATAPAPVATPSPSTMVELRLPLNEYLPSLEEQATGDYLVYRVQQHCMRGYGFRYLPDLSAHYIGAVIATGREYDSRRYGISDRAIAAEHGYHLSQEPPGTRSPQPATALSLPEREVLSGRAPDGRKLTTPVRDKAVPDGGCAGEAERTVHLGAADEVQRGYDLVARLRHEMFVRSRSDARIAAVNRKWSSCMRDHGFSYRDPDAAIDDPRWDLQNSAGPSRREISVATADISCKLRTNLLGVNSAVEAAYENTAIRDHARELEAVRAHRDSEVERLPGLTRRYGRAP